jgi:site-specific DNA-methyltransferase (adenine-specific)
MNYPEDFINKIICGDCLEVMKDIPDDSIDLIVTDPPYGISYKSNRQGLDRKHNIEIGKEIKVREQYFTEISNDDVILVDWINQAHRILKQNSALYVFCHWKTVSLWSDAISSCFNLKNVIVLHKSNHGMGDLKGSYAPSYELLIYACKGRHILNKRIDDVWNVPIRFTGSHRFHPNEKPLSWMTPAVETSSSVGDVVLDVFCGSGSTLLASKKLGRNFIGIDISEEYCDVARKRISEVV